TDGGSFSPTCNRHGQPARTLTLPSRWRMVPACARMSRRSAPRFTPSGPGSRQPFTDENIADVVAFDADRRQGPAIAVCALTQDFDLLAIQKLGQPVLRLQRQVGFIRALPLDLGSVD